MKFLPSLVGNPLLLKNLRIMFTNRRRRPEIFENQNPEMKYIISYSLQPSFSWSFLPYISDSPVGVVILMLKHWAAHDQKLKFKKIDRNLYELLTKNEKFYMKVEEYKNTREVEINWINIDQEITIELLESPINWNLGLLK